MLKESKTCIRHDNQQRKQTGGAVLLCVFGLELISELSTNISFPIRFVGALYSFPCFSALRTYSECDDDIFVFVFELNENDGRCSTALKLAAGKTVEIWEKIARSYVGIGNCFGYTFLYSDNVDLCQSHSKRFFFVEHKNAFRWNSIENSVSISSSYHIIAVRRCHVTFCVHLIGQTVSGFVFAISYFLASYESILLVASKGVCVCVQIPFLNDEIEYTWL